MSAPHSKIPRELQRATFPARDITDEVTDLSATLKYGGPSDIHTAVWNGPSGPVKVAVKVVRVTETEKRAVLLKRLRSEIIVWQELDHDNIHPFLGLYWRTDDLPALVSPWCKNGDANSYLAMHKEDPNVEVLKIQLLHQAISGVEYLHTRNPPIVHADIKGANVLVSDTGIARVCDFGISRIIADRATSSFSTGIKGTRRWMAPELIDDDDARHTVRSDIWACGCLILEILTGDIPFSEIANEQAFILAVSKGVLPARLKSMLKVHSRLIEKCLTRRLRVPIILSRLKSIQRLTEYIITNYPTANLANQDNFQKAINRMVSILRGTFASRAPAGPLLDAPDLEILEILTDIEAAPLDMLSKLHSLLGTCLEQFNEESSDEKVVITARAIAKTLPEHNVGPIASAIYLSGLFPPSMLRPLASRIARDDPFAAERLMLLRSSPFVGTFDAGEIPLDGNGVFLPRSVAFLPDGQHIAVTCTTGFGIWDTQSYQCVARTAKKQNGPVMCMAVSKDGTFIATRSCNESCIRLWDARSAQPVGVPLRGYSLEVQAITFSTKDDITHLASVASDGSLCIWDIAEAATRSEHVWRRNSPKPIVGPVELELSLHSVTWSPDGDIIACGGDRGALFICSAQTGAIIYALRSPSPPDANHSKYIVQSLSFSSDGKLLASGEDIGFIHIWDVESRTISQGPMGSPGYEMTWICGVAFSPRDGTLASYDAHDRAMSLWDVSTGEGLSVGLRIPMICGFSFSPDGKQLAVCASDKIWVEREGMYRSTDRISTNVDIVDMTGDWRRYDI